MQKNTTSQWTSASVRLWLLVMPFDVISDGIGYARNPRFAGRRYIPTWLEFGSSAIDSRQVKQGFSSFFHVLIWWFFKADIFKNQLIYAKIRSSTYLILADSNKINLPGPNASLAMWWLCCCLRAVLSKTTAAPAANCVANFFWQKKN